MKTNFFFLWLLISMSGYNLFAQQVKNITALSVHKKDTTIYLEREYSREGYLLTDHIPCYYVFRNYEYDGQGRLKESSQVYGESHSNGGTSYEYYDRKTCSNEGAAMYTRIICDSLSADNKWIYRHEQYTDFREEPEITTTTLTHVFYEGKLRIREELIRLEPRDSSRTDTTRFITTYTYNPVDSLTERLTINVTAKDTLERYLAIYDSITHLKLEELHVTDWYQDFRTTYTYDEKKRLVVKSIKEFSEDPNENNHLEAHHYMYENDELVKVMRLEKHETGICKVEDVYENNLIQKTFHYYKGKKREVVNYYYTFW